VLDCCSDRVVLDDMEACEEAILISYTSDILAGGLDVIFCGLNPALTAAVAGHNFSNGTNRFWTVRQARLGFGKTSRSAGENIFDMV
jgi:hypothetical protein